MTEQQETRMGEPGHAAERHYFAVLGDEARRYRLAYLALQNAVGPEVAQLLAADVVPAMKREADLGLEQWLRQEMEQQAQAAQQRLLEQHKQGGRPW